MTMISPPDMPTNAQAAAAARALIATADRMAEEWALRSGATSSDERARARDAALAVVIADAIRGHFDRSAGLPPIWRDALVLVVGMVIGGLVVHLLGLLP